MHYVCHIQTSIIGGGPVFAEYIEGMRDANATLIEALPDLLDAAESAIPWLSKMIADEGHVNCARPSLCVEALRKLEGAVKKARAES